jgi:hypothetical protein
LMELLSALNIRGQPIALRKKPISQNPWSVMEERKFDDELNDLQKCNGICSYMLLPISWAVWKLRICSTESISQYFLRPANDPVAGNSNHFFVIVSRRSLSCTAVSTIVLLKQIICNWFSGFTFIYYECWRCFLGLLNRMSVDFVAKVSEKLASSFFIVSVIGERNRQAYVGMRSIEPTGRSEEVMPIPYQLSCEQINLTQGSFQSHKLTCCIHRYCLFSFIFCITSQ